LRLRIFGGAGQFQDQPFQECGGMGTARFEGQIRTEEQFEGLPKPFRGKSPGLPAQPIDEIRVDSDAPGDILRSRPLL
jgi:hypothetical protein